ncbi:MAG: patatin-like phospholipase family protein, partial [Candidatus Berkelbacteria bacterium]|nr:patatin-like phospholipase family protein [Candidatus Berkelbacteria bacterium]
MKVGLALSGGGVLGAAHLGALREIEKQKIKINLVSGTSSGAILGALFCAGGTDSIENFLTDLATAGLIGQRGVFPILPDTIFK